MHERTYQLEKYNDYFLSFSARRFIIDLGRNHVLFTLSTPFTHNAFLIFKGIASTKNKKVDFVPDYKLLVFAFQVLHGTLVCCSCGLKESPQLQNLQVDRALLKPLLSSLHLIVKHGLLYSCKHCTAA